MKVVSQDGAIATMLFMADEVKPLKGYHLPALLKAIGDRYGAVKSPSLDDARTTGAKFENAIFVSNGRDISIPTLALHNDGFSISTTDTDDSEIVLNDLFGWLKEEFNFRDPATPAMCIYQSDLIVQFDNNPEEALGLIAPFLSFIQEEMTPANAYTKKPVQFGGMWFGADPLGPGGAPEFTIGRRINTPWRLGLYFSKANMKTSAHVRALTMLDGLLGKKR